MKFQEVQKYMTQTHHTYHTYAAVMNKDAWDSLTPEVQEIVQNAFDVARDYARELTIEDGKQIMEEISDQIEIIQLTDEGREKFIESSQPIYDEIEKVVNHAVIQLVTDADKEREI